MDVVMKRILAFLMAIFAVVSLAGPASAAVGTATGFTVRVQ